MILQAQPVGPAFSRRYIVRNLDDKKIWNGQRFVINPHRAALYATVNDACLAMKEIQIAQYGHLPRHRYRVPVEIEVYGKTSERAIIAWLKRATEFNLRTEVHGNGPDGCLVMPTIHYGLLQDDELRRMIEDDEQKRKRKG